MDDFDFDILDGDWLDFLFEGVWCVLRGLRGDCYAMSVRRKGNSRWGCVLDDLFAKLKLREEI